MRMGRSHWSRILSYHRCLFGSSISCMYVLLVQNEVNTVPTLTCIILLFFILKRFILHSKLTKIHPSHHHTCRVVWFWPVYFFPVVSLVI